MIEKITFSNYKAFENGYLELKPITILLGTNSSGKSSIIQFLMMLKQTISNQNNYESALKLNGKYINLGEIENVFRNRNTSKNLKFSLKLDNKSNNYFVSDLKFLKRNVENEISDLQYQLIKLDERFNYINNINNSDIRKTKSFEDEDFDVVQQEIKKLRKKLNKKNLDFSIKPPTNSIGSLRFKEDEIQELLKKDINELFDSYTVIKTIVDNYNKIFELEYEIEFDKKLNSLKVIDLCIKNEKKILLQFSVKNNKGQKKYILNSEFIENKIFEKYRVAFGRQTYFDKLSLKPSSNNIIDSIYIRKKFDDNFFCGVVLGIFNFYTNMLTTNFYSDKVNYVSPLRAFPKRYYFLDESNASNTLDSIDGDSLTEILKKHSSLVLKINKWFEKFGLSVGVEDVKEVIHRLKINQNGLSLDITDVGFGISQVLPIIVQGFLSKNNSLTIIEQPEIHLHPMMQAELADLFIDIANSENNIGKKLIIETHSESLLKRLRRRIAEGKISSDDIAIYFVHGRSKKTMSAKIERIEISETGAFDWPQEFYSTDFEDTKEFLKYQP